MKYESIYDFCCSSNSHKIHCYAVIMTNPTDESTTTAILASENDEQQGEEEISVPMAAAREDIDIPVAASEAILVAEEPNAQRIGDRGDGSDRHAELPTIVLSSQQQLVAPVTSQRMEDRLDGCCHANGNENSESTSTTTVESIAIAEAHPVLDGQQQQNITTRSSHQEQSRAPTTEEEKQRQQRERNSFCENCCFGCYWGSPPTDYSGQSSCARLCWCCDGGTGGSSGGGECCSYCTCFSDFFGPVCMNGCTLCSRMTEGCMDCVEGIGQCATNGCECLIGCECCDPSGCDANVCECCCACLGAVATG